jgi:glycosyltransferase involved in cell wall biosynthesis
MSTLNILFLTAHLPVLGLHGGGMRMFYNLKILAEKHRVTLLSFIESEQEREKLPELEALGIEVKVVRRRPCVARHLLVPKPREHDEFASPDMKALVQQTLAERRFDVVQAEFFQMGQHVPDDRSLLRILTEHEVQFVNFRAEAKREGRPWGKARKRYDWLVQLNYEVRTCRRFDRIACMTTEDLEELGRFVPQSKLRAIPIGVDSDFFAPLERKSAGPRCPRVLFLGNYRHPPNQDAVSYFAREILPLVTQQVPNVEFWIAGAGVDLLDRRALEATDRVRLVGYVPDVRSCYAEADVFVAPIRMGNGMRVKLLEAFSMAMPVVASPLAVFGFNGTAGKHFVLADSKQSFAEQTVGLLKDPGRREVLGSNARQLIKTHYDWEVLRPQFLDLVEREDA